MTIEWTAIILAIISFLSGLGWMLDRKKHRQEVESLKADNRMKDMELGNGFVSKLTSSTSVATRQCLKASFRHCARCSVSSAATSPGHCRRK